MLFPHSLFLMKLLLQYNAVIRELYHCMTHLLYLQGVSTDPEKLGPKAAVVGGKDVLQLLNHCSGSFRPGILTALVGSSGAGKTTLMDVLAGRKTSEPTIAYTTH